MHILSRRQFLRHEADLDERPHPVVQQPVINLINVGKVVDQISLLVLVVYSNLIVQNVVESQVTETGNFFHFPQITAITLAQRKNGPPRTKRLFPEVWEWPARGMTVDGDFLS